VQDTPRRRKVLFFIGSSIIWQSSRPVAEAGSDTGCEVPLKDARNAMFAAVDRANLTVHSIDPQGLVNLGPQTRAGARGGFNDGPAQRLRQQQVATTDSLTSRQNLQVLPERTGGRTVFGQNQPDEAVPAIFRESEAYYVLGVERGASDRPEKPRSIEVKVGRKGLRVIAQRQYVLPSAQLNASAAAPAPTFTQDALSRLLPGASLPLAMAITAFASPDSTKAIVRVSVDAGAFAHADGSAAPLEVAVMAVDGTGKSLASARQTSTISGIRPAGGGPAEVYVASHLALAAGDYGIRVAVSDPATGKLASVFSEITVPQFDTARLSLSSVNVDLATAPSARAAATMRRAFRRADQVRAVLQIYQGTERTDPIAPVSMRVQILDAKGVAVRDQSLPFTEKAFTNRRADCVITLPLAALPPGEYLLKLEASMDRQTAGRALRFVVE
jgi:hypothetical protein